MAQTVFSNEKTGNKPAMVCSFSWIETFHSLTREETRQFLMFPNHT